MFLKKLVKIGNVKLKIVIVKIEWIVCNIKLGKIRC